MNSPTLLLPVGYCLPSSYSQLKVPLNPATAPQLLPAQPCTGSISPPPRCCQVLHHPHCQGESNTRAHAHAPPLYCQVRHLDIHLYGAGLVGNLASHTASQTVIMATRGLARELVRILRDGKDRSAEMIDVVTGGQGSKHVLPAAGAVRSMATLYCPTPDCLCTT